VLKYDSERPNVTVAFSPDDSKFLVSSIDNHVSQYNLAGQRPNPTLLEIPQTGSSFNYTRSYYSASGESIISGSSNDDHLHFCDASSGRLYHSPRMHYAKRHPSLFIQSLRGHPRLEHIQGVLVCYRQAIKPYELVLLDWSRNHKDEAVEPPLPADPRLLIELGEDLRKGCIGRGDVLLLGSNRSQNEDTSKLSFVPSASLQPLLRSLSPHPPGMHQIRCDSLLLQARWPWFREALCDFREDENTGGGCENNDSTTRGSQGRAALDLDVPAKDSDQTVVVELQGMELDDLKIMVNFLCTGDLLLPPVWPNAGIKAVHRTAARVGLTKLCQLIECWLQETRCDPHKGAGVAQTCSVAECRDIAECR